MTTAGNRPPKVVSEERLNRIWQLSAMGWTQLRIGQEVGLGQQTVSKHLNRMLRESAARRAKAQDEDKEWQNQVYRYIIHEALKAWRKSKKPLHSVRTAIVDGEERQVEILVEQTGLVGYLLAAMEAMRDVAHILGLNIAPAPPELSMGIAQLAQEITHEVNGQSQGQPAAVAPEQAQAAPPPAPQFEDWSAARTRVVATAGPGEDQWRTRERLWSERELWIKPRPGESGPDYRQRVEAAAHPNPHDQSEWNIDSWRRSGREAWQKAHPE